MSKPTIIKLGNNELELRYDMESILELDEQFKINLYARATYGDFSPLKLRALVWAGQLYVKNPMSLKAIGKLLPREYDNYLSIALAIAAAIRIAQGLPEPATEPVKE